MISCRVEVHRPEAHLFRVALSVPSPAVRQRVSLPVWIPGSYLVREFARHLHGMQASQHGRPVRLSQVDKASWIADCDGSSAPLELGYLVYAFDVSVRAAFLDTQRGFFNGTSLFLQAEGREDETHELLIEALPSGWRVATAMRSVEVDDTGCGRYLADDYDELVDHPVELGIFWRGEFSAHGVAHEFVVAGALPDFDGERLLADCRRICEAEIAFWHPDHEPPFGRYVFLLNALDDAYGGLEHRASTALIANRRDLPARGQSDPSDGYVTLLGLISHEYFHSWNVKRMRPAEFARYDYSRENYTEMLWFFEGFTSYYDDLLLLRAGLIDAPRYLKLMSKTLNGVLGAPGREVQSVARSSFDAWVKYYRQDENTPNATISYYTKGALIALALDLTLRREQRGTLDDVMRGLWLRSAGGPIGESDIAQVLRDVSGRSFDDELAAWVHGTDDLPWQELLKAVGIDWQLDATPLAQRLGMKVSESALTGIRVVQVWRGGAAEAAGFAPGDELLGAGDWRLRRLDDALRLVPPGESLRWLVSRDQRLVQLQMALPGTGVVPSSTVRLVIDAQRSPDAGELQKAWLAG